MSTSTRSTGSPSAPTAASRADRVRAALPGLGRRFGWELLLAVLILVAMAWATTLSPYYLEAAQILGSAQYFAIFGVLAFGLMVVVVQGEIDVSIASTLAVGTVTLARLAEAGWPIVPAALVVLVLVGLLGAVNGLLVAYAGLPSLAVTVGTLGAYRGLAYVIGGDAGFSTLPDSYTFLGSRTVGLVPISLLVFALLAAVTGVVMSSTTFGRHSYAVGTLIEASRLAGVPVAAVKLRGYVVAGLCAGVGSILWVGQYYSARADNADGSILFVLTAVVLGGVSIKGGSGSVGGVVLAVLLLGVLSNGMGLANFPGTSQTLVLGFLLVLSIGLPRTVLLVRTALRRRRRTGAQLASTGG